MANDKDFIVENAVEVGGSTKTTLGTITANNIDLSTGNYFNDTLTSNTTYTISNAGSVQTFQLEVTNSLAGYVISVAGYDGKSFDASSQDTNPYAVQFSYDGTKMYILGQTGDDVNQYSLSTAWDISTASFDSVTFSVASQETGPYGLAFKPDGTIMYVSGAITDTVYQYTLSTAWDLSTASYANKSFNASAQTNLTDVKFKSDGTKMYLVDVNTATHQYALSTAWDVSTASYENKSLAESGSQFYGGLGFNSDGTKYFTIDGATDNVKEYNLSTAWDISTGSASGTTFSTAGQSINPRNGTFSTSGHKFYVIDNGSDDVFQYSSASVYSITWPNSIEWSGGAAPIVPENGQTDLFTISTDDGGTTYHGFTIADNLS